MSKIILEFADGPHKWRQVQAVLSMSRKHNYFVKHNGQVFVFEDLRRGTKVFSKVDGTWQVVGRVSWGNIFVGPSNKQSYSEWSRSSEGLKQSKQALEEIRASFQATTSYQPQGERIDGKGR